MYPTAGETWRAWPRSLNMRDATERHWHVLDALFLVLVQALPLPLLLALLLLHTNVPAPEHLVSAALVVNGVLVGIRVLISVATAHCFARRGPAYWLAPLADLPAVARVVETIVRRPREWRGAPRAGFAGD
jgi:dolichol-phosphate mannosyltransferase